VSACRSRWRLKSLLLWSAAMATVSLVLLPVPGASAAGPCTDVEIVGLRGSGEPLDASKHDMGSLVGPVADALASQLSEGATVGFYGVPYPAGEASLTTTLSRSYFRSKDQGVSDLKTYVVERIAACPATKLVVMGYSQGAHAAGDMLADAGSDITDRVAALVMFGDPRFNPEADYTFGTFDSRNYGLNGKRSLSEFSGDKTKVYSFCNQYDPICQGADKFVTHGAGTHSQTLYRENYESLAGGLVRRALGYTTGSKVPLDLAFVIDSTGSMGGAIDGVESAAQEMVDTLYDKGADFRVGLVDYKDTDQGDPYAARVDLPMTTSASAFGDSVAALEASGGGDIDEAVYSGLMTAYGDLSWRTGARKAIVLMGDAPAKNPEPITGYTQESVIAAAAGGSAPESVSGARAHSASASALASVGTNTTSVYSLPVGGYATSSFQPLSDGTGGELFQADNPSDVANEMITAVDAAAAPVYATLAAPPLIRTGTPVKLVAAGHYSDGEIARYEWDFDDDGTVDLTTPGGHTVHTFTAPFEGNVAVTARTDDGHSAEARATISVRDDAPLPPGGPAAVSAAPSGSGVTVAWTPPADLGGGTLAGYAVHLVSAASGDPVATTFVQPELRNVGFAELDPGAYTATVNAVTEAGPGPESSVPFTIAAAGAVGPAGTVDAIPPSPVPVVFKVRPRGVALALAGWRGRRLRLRLRCPQTAATACVVSASLSRRAKGTATRLTRGRVTVPAGKARTLVLRVSRRQVRQLRSRGVKIRLTLRTTTAAGTVTKTRRLTQRPPAPKTVLRQT
jgi:hypothetical protein